MVMHLMMSVAAVMVCVVGMGVHGIVLPDNSTIDKPSVIHNNGST